MLQTTTEKLDILDGRLAALEAFVLTVAETCMTASIRDLDKLSLAMSAIELAMVQRAQQLAQQMGTLPDEPPEGAAHVEARVMRSAQSNGAANNGDNRRMSRRIAIKAQALRDGNGLVTALLHSRHVKVTPASECWSPPKVVRRGTWPNLLPVTSLFQWLYTWRCCCGAVGEKVSCCNDQLVDAPNLTQDGRFGSR
jgi:hypothetical protein